MAPSLLACCVTWVTKTKKSHDGILNPSTFAFIDDTWKGTTPIFMFWIWRIFFLESRQSPVFDETLSTSGLIPKARPIYMTSWFWSDLSWFSESTSSRLQKADCLSDLLWINRLPCRLQKADCLNFWFEVDRIFTNQQNWNLLTQYILQLTASRTEGFDVWNFPQNFGRKQQCYHQRTHW